MIKKIIEHIISTLSQVDVIQNVRFDPEMNTITIEYVHLGDSIQTYKITFNITDVQLVDETKLELQDDIDIESIESTIGYKLTEDEKQYVHSVVDYIKKSKYPELSILLLENEMFDYARFGDERRYAILKEIIKLLEN